MRLAVWLIAVGALAVAATAHARAFRQTYGATVPAAGGGCVWNINQDYFVPRQRDSCRYDLFSACKRGHTTSPACRHLHPVHSCYCTPFGEWHYLRRDHIYKKHCGCTPLSCYHGPWKLERCKKHCFVLRHECMGGGGCASCSGGVCTVTGCGELAADCGDPTAGFAMADPMMLPNVESMAGETLGYIPALPRTAGGGGSAGSGGLPGTLPNVSTMPGLPAPGGGPLSFPTSSGPMALPPDSTY